MSAQKRGDSAENILHSLGIPIDNPRRARVVALVTYSLETLDHSKKTLFGYALKGRAGQTGFLDGLGGETVGRNNVLIPIEALDRLKEFLSTWRVDYAVRRFVEINDGKK